MPVTYRNFKAWIYCEDDRKILEEYEAAPDPNDETAYTCWVASEAGKRFTVHWENLVKTEGDNKGVIFVDGVEANFYINTMASKKGGASSGVKLATGELRPYSFSNVVLTDDDSYLGIEQSSNADELGNITLKIYPVSTYYEPVRNPHRPRRPRRKSVITLYDGAIHETTKKICDHRITLGDAMPFGPPSGRPRSRIFKWEPRDHKDSTPSVVFRFKYRPRAYLQAQGIIPRSPCVEATPQKPVIDMNSLHYGMSEVGHKRKRPLITQDPSHQNISSGRSDVGTPLFLPSPSREPSLAPDYRNILHAQYFETPRATIRKDYLALLGHAQLRHSKIQDENTNSPLVKRTKLEPMRPIKKENEVCLRVDERGVIDLTMED